MNMIRKFLALNATALLLMNGSVSARGQEPPPVTQQQPAQPQYRMHVTSELVLINVVVRDKKGNLVRDLKKEDFSVAEDGKRQDISTFDFENVDALATAGAAETSVSGAAGSRNLLKNTTSRR